MRSPSERDLRRALGVPDAAEKVVVVAETTHWDPNWLLTSEQYYRLLVRRTLDRVLDALVAEPRRVFGLECAFFPAMYWDRRPARRERFRELVNDGRLRFTGGGVTTPDTLLPEDELLLRDLLIGQEWRTANGMPTEPRVLYLPDSFGHSPGLPSVLGAAGVPYVGICRIDGMRFPGADMEPARNFPRPGTSAALLTEERSADFVWRGPDGSEVLAHWHAFGYGHGDMIASGGLSRALGLPAAWPDRREPHVARRIERYIQQLSELARTPYLLLNLGFDFVDPVPRLVELLDRWNTTGYERTGTWLVNAGPDEYFDLVAHHRDALPTLALDPNPYWMGFYASRPDLKAACTALGRRLLRSDDERARATLAPDRPRDPRARADQAHAAAWWTAVATNHHDYVTGTAPDRVAHGEQRRWLDRALADVDLLNGPARHDPVPVASGTANDARSPWRRQGSLVSVTTNWGSATFDEARGGALVSLTDAAGTELLAGPGLELRSYRESGGLWRMGQEFRGGRWALADRSTAHRAHIQVAETPDAVRLTVRGTLDERPTELVVELAHDDPGVVVHSSLVPPRRRTVSLALHQRTPVGSLAMHQPGGVVERPLAKWYEPTYWPLHSFAVVVPAPGDEADGPATVVATVAPTALHACPEGDVEVVVARTATKELAWGVVPVLAPAWGRRWGTQTAVVAVGWARPDGREARISGGRELWGRVRRAAGHAPPAWLVEVDDPRVEVVAVKPSERQEHIVVRVRSWAVPGSTPVRLSLAEGVDAAITAAWRADSNERHLEDLSIVAGSVRVDLDRHLTTVVLCTGARAGG